MANFPKNDMSSPNVSKKGGVELVSMVSTICNRASCAFRCKLSFFAYLSATSRSSSSPLSRQDLAHRPCTVQCHANISYMFCTKALCAPPSITKRSTGRTYASTHFPPSRRLTLTSTGPRSSCRPAAKKRSSKLRADPGSTVVVPPRSFSNPYSCRSFSISQ